MLVFITQYDEKVTVFFITIEKWKGTDIMEIWVLKILKEGYKIRTLKGNYYCKLSIDIVPSCQKVQKSDIQSKFSIYPQNHGLRTPNEGINQRNLKISKVKKFE